jgi:predicted HTH transcriptional regulator
MEQIPILIAVGILGIWLGRLLGARRGKGLNKNEMTELRQKAQVARSEKVQSTKDKILQAAKQRGKITNNDVERMFCGMSDSTAGRYLNDLEKEGKLKQIGEHGRGVYYVPA